MIHTPGDNQGALTLIKSPHLFECSKHTDICHCQILDLVEKIKLDVTYILKIDIFADGITKPLLRIKSEKFKSQLRVVK